MPKIKDFVCRLLRLLEDAEVDSSGDFDTAFIDFSKAFNSTCHNFLLAKLDRYRMRDIAQKVFSVVFVDVSVKLKF